MSERKCPETMDDLENLVIGLTDPVYDKKPEEPKMPEEIPVDGEKLLMYHYLLPSYREDLKRYSSVLEWGANRQEAITNYTTHFYNPNRDPAYCGRCFENYRDWLLDQSFDLLKDLGEDEEDSEKFDIDRYADLLNKGRDKVILSIKEHIELQRDTGKLLRMARKLHSLYLEKFRIPIPETDMNSVLFKPN